MAALWAAADDAWAEETLMFQAGSFDTFRGTESGLIGIEFGSNGPSLRDDGRELGHASLITGGSVTGRLGGYVYAGGRVEFALGRSDVSVAGSFAPGVFFAGRGKNLGGALEFRSGVEGAVALSDGATVGVGLFHYSNGKLYKKNPGSEALMGIYHFPMGSMLGL